MQILFKNFKAGCINIDEPRQHVLFKNIIINRLELK